jgi:hypothetical protein
LSTAITKDGQTATTVRIPFAQGINSSLTTDTTSGSTGSIITAGGVGIAKALFVGTNATVVGTLGVTGAATFSATPVFSALTASSAVATDASKNLVSVTNTGTGNNVLATSPTLVTPVLGAASATSVTVDAGAVGTPSITTTGDTNTGIFFPAADTIAFAEGGAEAMRIDSSGNVGIGTTSPSQPLDVVGAAQISFSGANTYLYFQSTSNYVGRATDGNFWVNVAASQNILFGVGASEKVRIDSSGNVLVGTTTRSNDEKFTVNQGAAIGISVRSTSTALGNYESSDTNHNTYWTFGRDNATTGNFVFAYGGTLRGSINLSTGTYTASSDSRLKKNITNITYGLNEVMALRSVTYLMNEEADTAKKHLGFIAQEVKALVDEAVDDLIDPDTQFYMLDKAGLVPVLVKAIQEQQALITSLTDRIVALEAK